MENGAVCFLKRCPEGIAETPRERGRLAFFGGISEKYGTPKIRWQIYEAEPKVPHVSCCGSAIGIQHPCSSHITLSSFVIPQRQLFAHTSAQAMNFPKFPQEDSFVTTTCLSRESAKQAVCLAAPAASAFRYSQV